MGNLTNIKYVDLQDMTLIDPPLHLNLIYW